MCTPDVGVLCMKMQVRGQVRGTKAPQWCREFFCCVLLTLQEEQKVFWLPLLRYLKKFVCFAVTQDLLVPALQWTTDGITNLEIIFLHCQRN